MTPPLLGLIATLFWVLLGNALISLQLIEDGTFLSGFVSSQSIRPFNSPETYDTLDTLFNLTGFLRDDYVYWARHCVYLLRVIRTQQSSPSLTQRPVIRAHHHMASNVSETQSNKRNC